MSYYKNSKRFYIKMYTDYFAYELYINQKYHKKDNNNIDIVWNGIFDHWILNEEEKKLMIKNAIEIANKEYKLKLQSDAKLEI